MEIGSSMSIMEDDVTLMETLNKMKSKEDKKKVSPRSPLTLYEEEEEEEEEEDDEEDDEEDELLEDFSLNLGDDGYDWDGFSEDECCMGGDESEEDLVKDSDRDEVDYGFEFFLVDKEPTVTNPRRPKKTYIPSHSKNSGSILYSRFYPLSPLAKLALDRYNAIRGTNYNYVGLVKAYKASADGLIFWIRFKACLDDQPGINFEAVIFQGNPRRPEPGSQTRHVDVAIQFVYPLP